MTPILTTGVGKYPIIGGGGGGGVSVNATGVKLYQGSLVTSINYTGLNLAAGTHSAIALAISWDTASGATQPSSVSCVWDSGGSNPQSMARIIKGSPGTGFNLELWGLVAPISIGNKTLAISWTTAARAFVVAMAFDNVDQT